MAFHYHICVVVLENESSLGGTAGLFLLRAVQTEAERCLGFNTSSTQYFGIMSIIRENNLDEKYAKIVFTERLLQ